MADQRDVITLERNGPPSDIAELLADIGATVVLLRPSGWKGWECIVTPMRTLTEPGYSRYSGESMDRDKALVKALQNAWKHREDFARPDIQGDLVCRI